MIPDALFAYLRRPDSVYEWRITGLERRERTTIYTLRLVSQTWQHSIWQHDVRLFVPDGLTGTEPVTLYVDAMRLDEYDTQRGLILAQGSGMPLAFLYDVPNQPLFDGLGEDALIARTFQQYLATGDADWPLLLPMAKSAVRAMDALQAFGATVGGAWTRFVVSGMSKRGWTAWLAGAADERVTAILPMVYDNLNLSAQLPHQIALWGAFSEMIHDYTDAELPEQIRTERGESLAALIDPYTYRERLHLPKLLVHGANDPYWATDAVNLYWNDLPGPKYLLDIPNAGHGLPDAERLFSTSIAFLRAVKANTPLPALTWEYIETPNGLHLTMQTETPAASARLWTADSATQDFRQAAWHSAPAQAAEGNTRFTVSIPRPTAGHSAVFGEAVFPGTPADYTLSTTPRLLP